MKVGKIIFILTLFGIIILLFLTNFNKPIASGKISSIAYKDNKTIITIENETAKIIVYNKTELDLRKKDYIFIFGKITEYENQNFIFVEKIIKKE